MAKTPIISLTRGHVDQFDFGADRSARLRGWIFREDDPLQRIDIRLNHRTWEHNAVLSNRPDVMAAYTPSLGSKPHFEKSGFDLTRTLPEGQFSEPRSTLIEIIPFAPDGTQFFPLLTHFCPVDGRMGVSPIPPVHLQERVGGNRDFVQVGAHAATLVMTHIARHKNDFFESTVLDWGCGCGRIISQLRKFFPERKLFGCDIDKEAIEWDKQNITGVTFTRVEPYPPTPYGNDSFDAVYGISVMTHLAEENQFLWLRELKRISKPSAILALSIIGENLRASNMPPCLAEGFEAKGFASHIPTYSDSVDRFSHVGYYQEAYHSPAYIESVWGKYFEVLEYVETGHQDVVILRNSLSGK